MPDDSVGSVGFRCAVCGCEAAVPFVLRGDGISVVRCTQCGMGVIDPICDNPLACHEDDDFGAAQRDRGGPGLRAPNHPRRAEHAADWAVALVRLVRPSGGRVLHIGCGDGRLLANLDPKYTCFGTEPDQAASRTAAERGVVMLGRDLADPILIERHDHSFDIIIAIGVFERLPDIRTAIGAALHLLRDDGVLVLEIPLVSAVHDHAIWLAAAPGQIWYPSERSLQQLVTIEPGARMVGTEIFITGHASSYVGLVFHEAAGAPAIRQLAARVLLQEADPIAADEATARRLLHVSATPAEPGAIVHLPAAKLNPELARRLAELWQGDVRRLELARTAALDAHARVRHLQAELETVQSDRARSHIELTTSLVVAQTQLAAVRSDLETRIEAEIDLGRQKEALDRDRAAANAILESFRTVQSGAVWQVAVALHETAGRYPRLARWARRVLRVLWWTARGRLFSQLRLRRQVRDQLATAAGRRQPLPLPTAEWVSPAGSPPSGLSAASTPEIGLLPETGHRPALPAQLNRPDDWPLVTVVVTSFNYGHFVTAAVDSVLAQTFEDLEVIVVEGGSSNPASRLVVAELHRPRTRVLMQGAGHKAGANRNFGISQARGRYVCCLDADDTLAPTYIEKAVFLLERHGYDVVSGAMEMVGGDQGQMNVMAAPDLAALLQDNHVLTCAVFRRSLWEEAGGYRDADRARSGIIHEDWAFWIRLAALGARFGNLHHDPVLRYRVHQSSLSRGNEVLPMPRQREMVQRMNRDVLQPAADRLARSRHNAGLRYGTPPAPPAPIILNRSPPKSRPPTVLLAMPFLVLGGAERLLSGVVAHLVKIGWRVVITTSVDPGAEHGDTTPWFERHTTEIFHLPRGFAPELWEDFVHHLVRSRGVDIVWVAGSAFAYDCLRGLRAAHPGLRVVDLLFNTVGHTENNRRRRDLIDLIFVESDTVRDWLLARGDEPERIRLIRSGVDLASLQPMARSDAFTRQIGAAPGDLIVGFSGRWSDEKNPLGFVRIAQSVDPALPVRFAMTGTGPLRHAIEQAVREAGFAEGRFHLVGEVPKVAPVLASFDLLVLPSVLDGRPVVVLEALALGVPVLASRVGALPELIQDGVTGWLCEAEDVQAFAAHIEQAAMDRARLHDMGRQAREYAEARLDVQEMLAAYTHGLTSLLSRDRSG